MQKHTDDDVRKRAYQIWQEEGQPDGHHERHWQRANEEFTQDRDEYNDWEDQEDGDIPVKGFERNSEAGLSANKNRGGIEDVDDGERRRSH